MPSGQVSYKQIEVEPLTPTIGALVSGVDLTQPVDDALLSEIHTAWMAHLVLFFRAQPMSPDQHLAFGRRFGELHIHPAAPYAQDTPELMVIHTDKDSFRNNGERWHSDVSADEEPPMGSLLHIHQVPSRGGDTSWSNMYAAYEALSPTMQTLLDPLTALHASDYSGQYGDHQPQRESPQANHPVVRTHPVTKQKVLFVNEVFTRRINELSREESRAVLDFLFDHVKNINFQCRFQWEADSVALWDNRCTQHMAVWDYYPESRSGIRVTIRGDRPF
ncbi:MAG: TauD/TfdA family dioxygenase [Chloroflexi bacterium]|nr:TauD/TfdA family dioxygenase [Chloroflexota bacterium]